MNLAAAYASYAFGCDFERHGDQGTHFALELPQLPAPPRWGRSELTVQPASRRKRLIERAVVRAPLEITPDSATAAAASTKVLGPEVDLRDGGRAAPRYVRDAQDAVAARHPPGEQDPRERCTALPPIAPSQAHRDRMRPHAVRKERKSTSSPLPPGGKAKQSSHSDSRTDAAAEPLAEAPARVDAAIAKRPTSSAAALAELMHNRDHLGARYAHGVYAAVWRAGDLDDGLREVDEEVAAVAANRLKCARDAKSRDRKRAIQWREAEDKHIAIAELRWLLEHDPTLGLKAAPQRGMPGHATTPTKARTRRQSEIDSGGDSGESDAGPAAPCVSAADTRMGSKCRRPLQRVQLKLKSSLPERQRNLNERRLRKSRRRSSSPSSEAVTQESDDAAVKGMRAILEHSASDAGLGMEFLYEVGQLREIFRLHDVDDSKTLDQAELMSCLWDLGLAGRTEDERTEVRKTTLRSLEDLEVTFDAFANKLVPAVRAKLADLREQHWERAFHSSGQDEHGCITMDASIKIIRQTGTVLSDGLVLKVLEELAPSVAIAARAFDGSLLLQKPVFDLETFKLFANAVCGRAYSDKVLEAHRLVAQYKISSEDRDLWGDSLLDLYEAFQDAVDTDVEEVSPRNFSLLIRSVGKMPSDPRLRSFLVSTIQEYLKEADEDGFGREGIDFTGFLQIIKTLHAQRCHGVFDKHREDRSALNVQACLRALGECGIHQHSQEERAQVLALIEEFDLDGSGAIDEDEFFKLVHFVQDRQHQGAAERERADAVARSLTDQEYKRLKKLFWEADPHMSNSISMSAANGLVDTFRGRPLAEDWDEILFTLRIDPAAKLQANMSTILRLAQASKRQIKCQQLVSQQLNEDTFVSCKKLFYSMKPDSEGEVARLVLIKTLEERLGEEQRDAKKQVREVAKRVLPIGAPVDLYGLLCVLVELGEDGSLLLPGRF